MNILRRFAWLAVVVLTTTPLWGDEPNALNPFDDKPATPKGAVLGYVELSDGSIHPGEVSLTRDKRLQLADDKTQQQREAPLSAVKQIDCAVKKEWMEKEWRFKETTSNEKFYTGRKYPSREYTHTITFQNGRKVVGGLSGVVFLQPLEYTPGATRTDDGRLAGAIHLEQASERGNGRGLEVAGLREADQVGQGGVRRGAEVRGAAEVPLSLRERAGVRGA